MRFSPERIKQAMEENDQEFIAQLRMSDFYSVDSGYTRAHVITTFAAELIKTNPEGIMTLIEQYDIDFLDIITKVYDRGVSTDILINDFNQNVVTDLMNEVLRVKILEKAKETGERLKKEREEK